MTTTDASPLRSGASRFTPRRGVLGQKTPPSLPLDSVTCPNERPSWWMPASHHCALDHELRRYPGITCLDYWRLFHLQGGVCAVCGKPPGKWRLAVDRDHETNELLGLTHHRCNRPITPELRRYVADPPGRALGLMADPEAVERAERRRQQNRQRKTTPPAAPAPAGYTERVERALGGT